MSDPVATVGSVWDRIVAFAEGLDDPDWNRSTPCPRWDVKDLLGHLSGIQRFFDEGLRVEPPEGWEADPDLDPIDVWTEEAVVARRGWSREQVLDELRVARDGHLRRAESIQDWTATTFGPRGETTEEGLRQVRMFDLWVHLQDLRLALDLPIATGDDSPAAVEAMEFVIYRVPYLAARTCSFPDGTRLSFQFGPPLDRAQVVEVSDGRGQWSDDADRVGSAIEADPAAFTLLLAGRGNPGWWRDEDLLTWRGEIAAAFVDCARLF